MLGKNRLASRAIVLTGVLFAAGALGGNEHAGKGRDATFEKLDGDGDGYVSSAEFERAPVHEQVDHDALDTDDDGRLSRAEFAAFELMSQDVGSEPRSGQRERIERRTDEPFQASDPTRDPGRRQPDR
ncbi:MAG TPA: EF-hand domain-containing protein [Pseudomonadales bacterium]